jgi:cytidylate kinase
MSIVLCFSGGIASGKTSLATAVADRLGAASASFGRFVRATALARGISEEREKLQALGESLIDEMGWPGFCRAVLDAAGWKSGSLLVIDGIRHVDALETIRGVVAPVPLKLVFVDVAQDIRQARAEGRPGEAARLAKADAHSTEKDVHHVLKVRADLVLDGTREQRLLVDEVVGAFASDASHRRVRP